MKLMDDESNTETVIQKKNLKSDEKIKKRDHNKIGRDLGFLQLMIQ